VRLSRGLLCARELGHARAGRLCLAVPRHPEADRLRAKRLLPANDTERIRRPLQRVVIDTHEQSWRRRGPQRKPRRDCARDE
jgi:hypothetical protein